MSAHETDSLDDWVGGFGGLWGERTRSTHYAKTEITKSKPTKAKVTPRDQAMGI